MRLPRSFPRQALLQAFRLVFLTAAGVIAAATACGQGLAGSRPNIIVVITDDQGYGPVGRHGHPWIRTPNLDAMHDAGARFTRFFVSPTCSPTRAAIMTGRHAMKNGVTHTILERERMALDAVTLPQVLQSAGYATGIFGKWHLGDEKPYQPEERGFDEVFIHGAGGIGQFFSNCSCADAPANRTESGPRYHDPVIRHNGTFVQTRGYCTDVFFTAALGWIREQATAGDRPFFAYISTNAPHYPFIAPEKNARRFADLGFPEEPAGFYGMIENIDENMGRLLAKVDAWGLSRDTLIVFMSDNGMTSGRGSGRPGEALGRDENGAEMFPYNAGMKGLKNAVDEGGVRVPFFVRWTGAIAPGRAIDRIAAHVDILPTFAALAGASVPPDQVEGRNLLPLIEDPSAATLWEDRFFFSHSGRWATGDNPDDHQWVRFSVRNQRFRLVGGALFDMEADPGQTKDVAAEHPAIVRAMREAYDRFWKETRPLMVNEDAPLSPVQPYHIWYEEQVASGGIPDWKAPDL